MAAPLDSVHQERARRLADPALHVSVRNFVRGRVPSEEVDDIVQTTLTDALAASDAPAAPEEFRRWLFGIAHNKVADVFRRRKRKAEDPVTPELAAPIEGSPLDARELLEWAEREVPSKDDARSTLEWMLREGDGDSLEEIAKDERLPAPRVRQRVSRLRRHLRSRWAILSAGLGLALLLGLAWVLLRHPKDEAPNNIIVKEEPKAPTPEEKARPIRELAFEQCNQRAFRECLESFDRAKLIDPNGEADQRVRDARRTAAEALTPAPQVPTPKAVPTTRSSTPEPTRPAPKVPSKAQSNSSELPFDSITQQNSAPRQKSKLIEKK